MKGGRPDQATRIDIRDIMLSVGQVVSEITKSQYFSQTLPSGETIPDGSMLATYENVAVEVNGERSRATLPAMPIGLPRGMGVFSIENPKSDCDVFIPALPGQLAMVKSQKMISHLSGYYAYEQYGTSIEFNKNLIKDGVENLTMRLLVSDVSKLGPYDPLPIPGDYEGPIIETVFQRFSKYIPNDKDTDVMTNNFGGIRQ